MFRASRNRGVSLLELMITMAIAGFVALVVSQVFLFAKKTFQQLTYTRIMKNIAAAVQGAVQNPEVLMFSTSLGVNYELNKCIWPTALKGENGREASLAPNCTATDPERQVSIELFQPPGDSLTFNPDRARIAGSESNPAWYDATGRFGCDPQSKSKDVPRCLFKVVAYFWANCPGEALSLKQSRQVGSYRLPAFCNRADTLNIRYQVSFHSPEESSGNERAGLSIPPLPADSVFWQGGEPGSLHTPNFAVSVGASQFTGLENNPWNKLNTCPPNFSLIAIVDGKAECECLLPNRKIDATTCQLVDNKCPPNKRYKGTDLGGNPICVSVSCSSRTISLTSGSTFDFACPPPAWLTKVAIVGPASSCVCKKQYAYPDIENKAWKYGCELQCPLVVTCCKEN